MGVKALPSADSSDAESHLLHPSPLYRRSRRSSTPGEDISPHVHHHASVETKSAGVRLRRSRVGHLHLVPTQTFGIIDGGVRPVDELLAPNAEGIAGRNPDAAREADGLAEALDANGGNPLENALCDGTPRRRVAAPKDHDKFSPAITTDDVGL